MRPPPPRQFCSACLYRKISLFGLSIYIIMFSMLLKIIGLCGIAKLVYLFTYCNAQILD